MGVLAEGAVRVRQYFKHGMASPLDQIFRIDPTSGLRVPSADKSPPHIRINSLGFRGPDIVAAKPPGHIRIAFLGASTTYCAEVSGDEASWPHIVWKELQDGHPDVPFDYVNAAVPGYSVTSSLKNLDHRVMPLRPDVIVLYEGFNDIVYDTATAARQEGLRVGAPHEESWLSQHSMLWFLVEKNLTIWRLQAKGSSRAGKLEPDLHRLSRGFEERLARLIAAGREIAPVVAIATMAPRLRRTQTPDERRRAAVTALYFMPYMTVDGILDAYDEYNVVIRRVAARHRAILIELSDAIPADPEHYTDSVHLTDGGSRVMAQRVSQALLSSPQFAALLADRPGRQRPSR